MLMQMKTLFIAQNQHLIEGNERKRLQSIPPWIAGPQGWAVDRKQSRSKRMMKQKELNIKNAELPG